MKKLSSKNVDLKKYTNSLKSQDWDTLSNDIITLEIEYQNLKPHLTKKEVILYKKLIELYEKEKSSRFSVCDKDYCKFVYGQGDYSIEWMEFELDDEML